MTTMTDKDSYHILYANNCIISAFSLILYYWSIR